MMWLLLIVPALPILAAVAITIVRPAPRVAARAATVVSGLALVGAVATWVAVFVNGPVDAVVTRGDGSAIVGLTADRVGAALLVLTTAVGLVVQSFASRSLLGDHRASRFHVLASILVASTALVATTATGTGLFVAWVATSVTLVALVGHKAPWKPALDAQRITALSFGIGDLALLGAVVVAITTVGDLDLRSVAAGAVELDASAIGPATALSVVAVLLVIAGVARSALVPLHRWLPSTLAAPTPVSALLHAGVVNGAGVLLIRLSPIFGASSAAMALAFTLGIITALVATTVMLVRTDVKGSLVWSTAGQMGFMVLQLGVGAFAAAFFHLIGHALYKATMFLGAGGAITAHLHQTRRPHLGRSDTGVLTSVPTRLVMGLALPLVAFAAALWLFDPHLSAAATILIVVFGTLSVGRASSGWLRSTPFTAVRALGLAVAGVVVTTFAYVAGITVFDVYLDDVVPFDVPAAVGPVWVAVVLAAIAVISIVVAFAPGGRGAMLRRQVFTWFLSTGAPRHTHRSPSLPRAAGVPSTQPSDRSDRLATMGEPA